MTLFSLNWRLTYNKHRKEHSEDESVGRHHIPLVGRFDYPRGQGDPLAEFLFAIRVAKELKVVA